MNQRSREKIALIVFAIAVVAFFVFIIAYLFYGHSWTITARNIDEKVGVMDGYTIVLYEGTHEVSELEEYERMLEAEKNSDSEAGETDEDAIEAPDTYNQNEEPDLLNSDSNQNSESLEVIEPINIEDLIDAYRSKGAQVLWLKPDDPNYYQGEDIFIVGDRRIGVFYASEGTSVTELIYKTNSYTELDVSNLICIADNAAFVRYDSLGIEAVLSLNYDPDVVNGTTEDGTLYCVSPLKGQVGAIIISPEGLVSTKVITQSLTVDKTNNEASEPTE